MTEQKPKIEREKLPIDYMMNEFMDQQLTTLDKLNKNGGKKENDDANANGTTKGKDLERD